ncbi:hypothetical protein [Nocardioides sp. GY 10127]|uniref:hypothetical protein n=1 Tax=Nocardioides sp. GY 10127 TaxID=2569762 RepID=UPI0010A887D5|nr:hypothetical protein [Nocardioides sp. GY 10127]TIC79283.1 hypothetical protein E8D37_16905 [Nocardioides sp. GY 10127]
MRRVLIPVLVPTLALVLALAALTGLAFATNPGSTVTKARLERALPAVFAHVYVQEQRLAGRTGLTVADLDPVAMCDRGGPSVADTGPGSDWVCLMSWQDPEVPMPTEGYGKFELTVRSNDCFTASSPSKLVGYATMTDASGKTVTNPAYEFDGCFDPDTSNTPTGHTFPSLLSLTSTTAQVDASGHPQVQLGCGTGSDGCAGTLTATVATADGSTGRSLGSVPFDLAEEQVKTVTLPGRLRAGDSQVVVTLSTTTGVGSSSPATLAVQGATG